MKFLLPMALIAGFFVMLVAREWLKSREQAEQRKVRLRKKREAEAAEVEEAPAPRRRKARGK